MQDENINGGKETLRDKRACIYVEMQKQDSMLKGQRSPIIVIASSFFKTLIYDTYSTIASKEKTIC